MASCLFTDCYFLRKRSFSLVNAADQVTSISRVSKLAATINLFQTYFPRATVDLSPWQEEVQSPIFVDKSSLDLAFHFPARHTGCQCSSILMQIQLQQQDRAGVDAAISIELTGHDSYRQWWQLATAVAWRFTGERLPTVEAAATLEGICRHVLMVFNASNQPSLQ
jgi:hypothetical protein